MWRHLVSGPAPRAPFVPPFAGVPVDDGNRLAILAAHAASEEGGGRFNPLLLYGPTGSGKTRILEAMQASLLARGRRPLLVAVRALAARHAALGRRRRLESFGGEAGTWDALLLDGVEEFAGRARFASAMGRWVEAMLRSGRLVVSAGRDHPCRLPGFEARLASLLDSGFSAPIGPRTLAIPSLEALAHECARRLGLLPYEGILAGRSRSRLVARARRMFAAEALGAGFGTAEIGRYLGGRTGVAVRRLARRGGAEVGG